MKKFIFSALVFYWCWCLSSIKVEAQFYVYKKVEVVFQMEDAIADSIVFHGPTQSAIKMENGHEFIDLGLSSGLLWASCNVGAKSAEGCGWFFAWGETEPSASNSYSWDSYKWCNGSKTTMTKYCDESDYGTVDNKTVLEKADDAASVNWGGAWRTPTDAEWAELLTECSWMWAGDYNRTGVAGTIFTGPNGNSIFLPAAGYWYEGSRFGHITLQGHYLSASLYVEASSYACGVDFRSYNVLRCERYRCYGCSVRPVFRKVE